MTIAPLPDMPQGSTALFSGARTQVESGTGLSNRRAYGSMATASSWEEIWEAGNYYQRISEHLEDAEDYVIFTGWQIDSRLLLPRPSRPARGEMGPHPAGYETLKEKILRLSEAKPQLEFFILMWDHAYFYVLEREFFQGRVWDEIHPRVHFIFDNRHPFGGAHHEKIAIIDGKVALCGGIDLCDDRWDSPNHHFLDPRRSLDRTKEKYGPYHDIAVQVTGPICAEIQEHIGDRWETLSSVPFPEPRRDLAPRAHSGHSVYISRTMAAPDAGEKGVPFIRETEFLFRELIRSAERRLILEGQYYWSTQINDLLIAKMKEMRGKNFEINLILSDLKTVKSLTRHMAVHEMRMLKSLETTARLTGTKLVMGAPQVPPPAGATREEVEALADDHDEAFPLRPRPVYIHSKVIVVDDHYLCIGSANLAERALRIDTELNLTLVGRDEGERAMIRRFGDEVLSHWNVENRPDREMYLRRFNPARELEEFKEKHPIVSRIPMKQIFDPDLPWMFRLRVRMRGTAHRHPWVFTSVLTMICVASLLLAVGIASLLSGSHALSNGWAFYYAAFLSAGWFFPIPFMPIAVAAVLHLGPVSGTSIVVAAFWINALLGYGMARFFPTRSNLFYLRTQSDSRGGLKNLHHGLGVRRFADLVRVVLDPRVSLRSKVAYQGLYCVHFPWFAVATLVLLPSMLFGAARLASHFAPEILRAWATNYGPALVGALTLLCFAFVIERVWRKEPERPGDLLRYLKKEEERQKSNGWKKPRRNLG